MNTLLAMYGKAQHKKWKTSVSVRFTISYNCTKILRFRPSPPQTLEPRKTSHLPARWAARISTLLNAAAEPLRREEPLEIHQAGHVCAGWEAGPGEGSSPLPLAQCQETLLCWQGKRHRFNLLILKVFYCCAQTLALLHVNTQWVFLFWTDSPCYTSLVLSLHRAVLPTEFPSLSTNYPQHLQTSTTHSHRPACLSPLNGPQQKLLSSLIVELQEVAPRAAQLAKLHYQQLGSYTLELHRRGLAKRTLSNSPDLSFMHSMQHPLNSFCSPNIPSCFSRCSIPGQQPISLPRSP